MQTSFQLTQSRMWPPCVLPSELIGRCKHCGDAIYWRTGMIFHINGYRACHWSAVTFAELR